MEHLNRLFDIHPWKLKTTQLHKDMRLQESLTSIGNGYMGMRGNFEEGYSGDHHQGTYLAGVWYPDKTRVGWWKNGYPDYFGKVINALNFLAMTITINDTEIDLAKLTPKSFNQELDLKNGLLSRSFTLNLPEATVAFTFRRFLSITTQEAAWIDVNLAVLDGRASVKWRSALTSDVQNEDSNYNEHFWEPIATSSNGETSPYLQVRTIPNQFDIEQFTVTAMMDNEFSTQLTSDYTQAPLAVSEEVATELKQGEQLSLTKRVLLVTSRDVAPSEQVAKAATLLATAKKETFDEALTQQTAAWQKRWELADVQIAGDDEAQQGIRFNLFQLFSTYYGEDERLNIGPKGFTGEKYGGATYWDTEAYAVPLYLALAKPEVTKNLLNYRYNQLPQAKHNARQQGLAGALYPMVTFTGIECHNEWEITFEEIHRNGAIAYAIYNYTNYTGDTSYLATHGLEVLAEIARFWADRVHFSKRKGQYMIHGVTGPNEYENNVNNNWYTNTLAAWVLQYTIDSYQKFRDSTQARISDEELVHWQEIIDGMYYPKDDELGIFVQHDTFLDKDLMPVNDLDTAELPLNQHWSWDKILRSCFIKQADVLQGIYFFGDAYSIEEKQRNFDFYEPMTVHESSLSPSIHAVLAAELGLEEKAVEMYQRTARLDLDNYNNDTQDGLHITSMTGSWLAIVQGFAQMKTTENTLRFAPFLPKNWQGYAFRINYRNRLLAIDVNKQVTLTLISGDPLDVSLYEKPYKLATTLTIPMPTKEED